MPPSLEDYYFNQPPDDLVQIGGGPELGYQTQALELMERPKCAVEEALMS